MRHIYTRQEWHARTPGPVALGNRPVTEAFIHNSDDSGAVRFDDLEKQAAKVKSIQDFHMGPQRGWSDIGYHFVVFQPVRTLKRARIFRGRQSSNVVPAAQLNHNTHTLAIVVIGDGHAETLKADTQRAILEILHRYHTLRTLGGHKDVTATACPGDRFYAQIPDLAHRAGLRRF